MNISNRYVLLLLLVLFGLGLAGSPARSQSTRIDFRAVNLVTGQASVDIFINNTGPAYITNLQFGYTSQNGRFPVDTSKALNLKFTPAGAGIGAAFLNSDQRVAANVAYVAVAYGPTGTPKLKMLARPYVQVPAETKSLVRVLNATTFASDLDFYFGVFGGQPAFGGVKRDSATPFVQQDGQPTTLTIAAKGATTATAELVVGLAQGSITTVIVTGSNASDLKVYQLDNDPTKSDEYQLPTLGAIGALPTIRSINALPPQHNAGIDSVDVYFGDVEQTHTLRYRGASAISTPQTSDTVTVKFVTAHENPQSGLLLSTRLPLKRDTAYSVVLTQFQNGAITPLVLKSSITSDPITSDVKFRVANATDYFGPLTFVVNPDGPNSARFESIPFLGVSDWDTIPAGNIRIAVYTEGATMPFYTGSYDASAGWLYTFIGLGDTTKRGGDTASFSVDVLNESVQQPFRRMFTFDGPLAAVPGVLAADRSMQMQIVPNPLGDAGTISFVLRRAGRTTVELFDLLGRKVGTFFDGWREAGRQGVPFQVDGILPGTYTCVVQSDDGYRAVQRVVVVH